MRKVGTWLLFAGVAFLAIALIFIIITGVEQAFKGSQAYFGWVAAVFDVFLIPIGLIFTVVGLLLRRRSKKSSDDEKHCTKLSEIYKATEQNCAISGLNQSIRPSRLTVLWRTMQGSIGTP